MICYHEKGRDPHYKIWNAGAENMIIYFHSDGGSMVFRNAVYPIEAGSICFVAAGNMHYTMPDDPRVYERSKVYLSARRTGALLEATSREGGFHVLFSKNAAVYAKIPQGERDTVERLLEHAAHGYDNGREENVVSAFFSLMSLIAEHAVQYIQVPDSFMARTVEYINAAYGEEITLAELCRVANMSKSHFCRKFKTAMGMTVMDYILKTRIAAAKSLLLSSDLSISEISERCGFSGVSFFSQRFKAETGMTASAFRLKA